MDLTQKIIGAAMVVHRALGPGLDEKIYENALAIELTALSLSFTQQQQFPVFYREQSVGRLITDLIVENKVIIETKVALAINDVHIAQALSYLSISGLKSASYSISKPPRSPSNESPISISKIRKSVKSVVKISFPAKHP